MTMIQDDPSWVSNPTLWRIEDHQLADPIGHAARLFTPVATPSRWCLTSTWKPTAAGRRVLFLDLLLRYPRSAPLN